MNWHLYKKADPSTWPQIDCPMVVCQGDKVMSYLYFWDNNEHCFFNRRSIRGYNFKESYYAYIGYVPSGYKTLYPIICTCKNCPEGYDDNGYCMDYDNDYICGCKKEVAEYEIKEKRIWKEFENNS